MGQDLPTQTQIPARFDPPGSCFVPTTQLSSSMAPSTDLMAWKLPLDNTRQLLTLNEQFIGPYHHLSEVPPNVRDMWWGRVLETHIWDQTLSMTKMRQAWEVKESPEYKAFCERNKRNKNEGLGGRGVRMHIGDSISFLEHQLKRIRTNRFSKSIHLKELHKHQNRDKKGISRGPTEGRGGSCSHERSYSR
ncbi:hypothetical protein M9H77_30302 [Catharanthus roseus]|uniref:Uncharacterized protein n=1 Tax=Catharanthus roseus TaxID=4058 RepID=A0ACB9ZXX1_CATRO|nr:hypothetical protein M9H77_30302 [Catharanthus roseus]